MAQRVAGGSSRVRGGTSPVSGSGSSGTNSIQSQSVTDTNAVKFNLLTDSSVTSTVQFSGGNNITITQSGGNSISIAGGAKNKLNATTDPAKTDDSSGGYSTGSIWVNTTGGKAWICITATADDADWNQIDVSGSGTKNNLSATTDPGVGNDSADGYAVGSFWINTTGGKSWICVSATAGEADWNQIDATTPKNKLNATTDPGVGDDTDDGYSTGSIWINTTTPKAWICISAASGAADWNQIDFITPKSNLSAATNPGVTDDSSGGYSTGSIWVNTTAKKTWICITAATGEAIWNQLDAVDFDHSKLTKLSWVDSGHTSTALSIASFGASGEASKISPPNSGERTNKVLAWISDSALGWATIASGSVFIFMLDSEPIIDASSFNADEMIGRYQDESPNWGVSSADPVIDESIPNEGLTFGDGVNFYPDYDIVDNINYSLSNIYPVYGVLTSSYNPATDIINPTTGMSAGMSSLDGPLDSDSDGIADNVEDANQNNIQDPGETDPFSPDSDADGLSDGQELAMGADPLNPDSDGDGVPDGLDSDPTNGSIT